MGYGGDIVCDPSKTTTVIGKFNDKADGGGTSEIINSGVYKVGENQGGINVLNLEDLGFDPSVMSPVEKWSENASWLDDAIARGDIIRSISNPFDNRNLYRRNNQGLFLNSSGEIISELDLLTEGVETYYKQERDYLQSAGYIYNATDAVWFLP